MHVIFDNLVRFLVNEVEDLNAVTPVAEVVRCRSSRHQLGIEAVLGGGVGMDARGFACQTIDSVSSLTFMSTNGNKEHIVIVGHPEYVGDIVLRQVPLPSSLYLAIIEEYADHHSLCCGECEPVVLKLDDVPNVFNRAKG